MSAASERVNDLIKLAEAGNYLELKNKLQNFPYLKQYRSDNGTSLWHFLAGSGNYDSLKQAIDDVYKFESISKTEVDFERYFLCFCIPFVYKTTSITGVKYYIVDIQNNDGETVWHFLARSGNYEALKQAIADYPELVSYRNNNGATVWHYLAESSYQGLKQAINDFPGLIDSRDNKGATVWHYLAKNNYQGLKQAIENYPDLCIKQATDKRGKTVWQLLEFSELGDAVLSGYCNMSGIPT